MQEPLKNGLDPITASSFEASFKQHFRQLEKQIHCNWRLHKAYYLAQARLCLATNDTNEALEIVKLMLATVKSKTCSLPVKRLICEKLAELVTTRPNHQVRQLIHKNMMTVLAVSRSSQQRQVFLTFLECLVPLISAMHYN